MLTPDLLRSKYAQACAYTDYVATGKPHHRESWEAFHDNVSLTESQRNLVAGFTRRVHALALSGVWCGDCVQHLPFLA
ncbi:MAG: thioredoxin family protein, partial [Phycisphaerales bacterium]|nr:thioredoxin family protein [Phycisphaerales bacterium]